MYKPTFYCEFITVHVSSLGTPSRPRPSNDLASYTSTILTVNLHFQEHTVFCGPVSTGRDTSDVPLATAWINTVQ